MTPLAYMTAAQRSSYASWAERLARHCRGRMREYFTLVARVARTNGETER